MAIAAAVFLVWKVKLAAYMIKSIAPIGALVTFIALVSGSIWGIPTWGTWWQWDARITRTLILFIIQEESLKIALLLILRKQINLYLYWY